MALNMLKNASDCGYVDANQKLGDAHYLKKNYKEAIDSYEKFIEKKGEGIHHIAFEVDDIHAEMERLRKEGLSSHKLPPEQ